ncbi:MAG TPA: Gfo/Idh/MocA family oxidoreductase, partial [Anaerolineaceae bacterium]|nr:Gfo/Idh/MocA family oxidoreductase [Anaerolineaceae bacterium]
MKVAVIGLGGIASKAYLPVLGVREDLELQLVSRTAETVRCFQDQYRIPFGATDLAEVEAWKPDAAFVLTPSPTHFEIAHRLLAAGIDVFIEKPATLHARQTRILAELAETRERVL